MAVIGAVFLARGVVGSLDDAVVDSDASGLVGLVDAFGLGCVGGFGCVTDGDGCVSCVLGRFELDGCGCGTTEGMIVTLGMEEWTKDEVTIDYDDGFLLESGDVIFSCSRSE